MMPALILADMISRLSLGTIWLGSGAGGQRKQAQSHL